MQRADDEWVGVIQAIGRSLEYPRRTLTDQRTDHGAADQRIQQHRKSPLDRTQTRCDANGSRNHQRKSEHRDYHAESKAAEIALQSRHQFLRRNVDRLSRRARATT